MLASCLAVLGVAAGGGGQPLRQLERVSDSSAPLPIPFADPNAPPDTTDMTKFTSVELRDNCRAACRGLTCPKGFHTRAAASCKCRCDSDSHPAPTAAAAAVVEPHRRTSAPESFKGDCPVVKQNRNSTAPQACEWPLQRGGVQPSIVVVGSSSSLLEAEQGGDIDRFHVVVRCNCAPHAKLEKWVGSTTTHRMTNEIVRPRSEAGDSEWVRNVVAIPLSEHAERGEWERDRRVDWAKRRAYAGNYGSVLYVTYDFIAQLRERFDILHPTTGFAAIALFSDLFSKHITITGFDFYSGDTGYYWADGDADLCGKVPDVTNSTNNARTFHDADAELKIMNEMIAAGKVSVMHSKTLKFTPHTWKVAYEEMHMLAEPRRASGTTASGSDASGS